MIENLNNEVWATLAPSPIHGVGVFAIRNIPKGQKIGAQSEQRVWLNGSLDGVLPEIKKIILQRWPLADKHPFLSPNDDARLLSFMNHSDTPNYDPATDTVLRDLSTGEELTENYGEYRGTINANGTT